MIRRLIERCENYPVGPGSWFLTFLAVAVIRLQVEILYLDYRRTPEFVILNLGYFLSLILSISLMLKFLTGEYLPRVLRAGLPFSAIILLPLLDLFFYPHLRGEELLQICRIPIFAEWKGHAIYYVAEILSHSFFLNPRTALGLRLEVLIGGVAVFLYIVCKARSRVVGIIKGVAGYLLYLTMVYVHVVLVVHPALQGWIFPPLVLAELMLCIGLWKAGELTGFISLISWPVVGFIAVGLATGYSLGLAAATGPAGLGEMMAVVCGLFALGVIAGTTKPSENVSSTGDLRRWSRNLSPVFCVLAVYPVHRYVFLSFALLGGLLYLCCFSPFQLARYKVVVSLMAGLAFWVSAWTGQVVLNSGPGNSPSRQEASTEAIRMPQGPRPFPGMPFPPPPRDRRPGPGRGPFPGDRGPSAEDLANHGPGGPMHPPFGGPPGMGGGPDDRSHISPPPPYMGMPMASNSGETTLLWPNWLYHPGWLGTPLVVLGWLILRKPRPMPQGKAGAG